ncbi:MAG: hypothetical protein WC873_00325 [Candidatus Gracilibacteria bacterium]
MSVHDIRSGEILDGDQPHDQPLNEPELAARFNNTVDWLNSSPAWAKVRTAWINNISDKDRLSLYQTGAPTIFRTLLDSIPGVAQVSDIHNFEDPKLRFLGGHNLAASIRWLVQLGLLPAPAGITKEMINTDLATDHKNLKRILRGAAILVEFMAPECTAQILKVVATAEAILKIKNATAKRIRGIDEGEEPSDEENYNIAA